MNKINENFILFLKAIPDFNDRGVKHYFTCPICNGKCYAIKSTYNGHLHASCANCGFGIHQ